MHGACSQLADAPILIYWSLEGRNKSGSSPADHQTGDRRGRRVPEVAGPGHTECQQARARVTTNIV